MAQMLQGIKMQLAATHAFPRPIARDEVAGASYSYRMLQAEKTCNINIGKIWPKRRIRTATDGHCSFADPLVDSRIDRTWSLGGASFYFTACSVLPHLLSCATCGMAVVRMDCHRTRLYRPVPQGPFELPSNLAVSLSHTVSLSNLHTLTPA